MKKMKINCDQDIDKMINKLRLMLNKTYETNGNTEEVVKLSQELDKYIVLAQQELLNLEKAKRKMDTKRE